MFKSSAVPCARAALTLRRLLAALTILVAGIGAAAAQNSAADISTLGLPDVLAARVSTTPQRARLIVDLSGITEFAIVSLDQPNRIAVDVRAAALAPNVAPAITGAGIVGSATIEEVEPSRIRTTLALAEPSQVQQAYVLDAVDDQPARLVVDLIGDTPEDFAARVATDLAMATAKLQPPVAEPGASDDKTVVADVPTGPGFDDPGPVVVDDMPTPAAAVPPPTGGSKPLVVIDPGHGGIDNGASAPNGLKEKDIVLAFALELQDVLVKSGKFDVALTRSDDTYLTLNERVTLARQNKADLFISLHADTFQEPDIRGASVYTRDERATDILDKVLAENENKVDIVAGFAFPKITPAVVDIMVDLMRREMRKQSYVAATDIINALKSKVALRRFPVRQADFFVLQAPDIPSMLIELGFLSNATDISNLVTSGWRDKVVAALSEGISTYFDDLKASR